MNMKKIISLAVLPFVLAACGGGSGVNEYGNVPMMTEESLDASYAQLGAPYLLAPAPRYVIGNPYRIGDIQYVPAEDLAYNQTGIAGIVPAELNGVQTTNGEVFNVNQMVATSKTLPLPTIVRVTNLENGRSVVVRVNNRGPFVNSRIMDVSPAAARSLGMRGNTRVQIQVLAEPSIQIRNAAMGVTAETAPAPVVAAQTPAPVHAAGGPYTVQLGAFYSEDGARSLARRVSYVGNATVVLEDGMHKVQIIGLDAPAARDAIDTLRRNEAMSPGLLMNGRWINADSI